MAVTSPVKSPVIVVAITTKDRSYRSNTTHFTYIDDVELVLHAVDRLETLHKNMGGFYQIHAYYPAVNESTGQIKLNLPLADTPSIALYVGY